MPSPQQAQLAATIQLLPGFPDVTGWHGAGLPRPCPCTGPGAATAAISSTQTYLYKPGRSAPCSRAPAPHPGCPCPPKGRGCPRCPAVTGAQEKLSNRGDL